MPSTNNGSVNAPTAAAPNAAGKTMKYEVLVLPHGDGSTEVSGETPAAAAAVVAQQSLRTKTKQITCTGQNGQVFWIPEGYRPVLVRTADLPLLVGTEFPLPSSGLLDDGEESN